MFGFGMIFVDLETKSAAFHGALSSTGETPNVPRDDINLFVIH